MRIERRSNAADQEFRAVADGEPVIGHRDGAVGDEALYPRPIDDSRLRSASVNLCDLRKVDRHVAHDPLDDVGAEAVFPPECVALGSGEPVLGNVRKIIAGRHDVLHETLGHAADGARTESDGRVGGVVRIALEIPTQPAFPLRHGEVIVGEGEVIEADAYVAGIDLGFRDGLGLKMPLDAVRQGIFRDLALMLLERGDVRIALLRNPILKEALMSIAAEIDDPELAMRNVLLTTRATAVCPFHQEVTIRIGDDAAETHAFYRARNIVKSDGMNCPACGRTHFVNRNTSKLLGHEDE